MVLISVFLASARDGDGPDRRCRHDSGDRSMNPAHHNGHGTSLPHGIDLITDGSFVCRERWRAGEAQIARPVRNEAKRRTLTVGPQS